MVIPKPADLKGVSQHLQYNMNNAAVGAALNIAGGQKVEEALKSGLINAVVNTAAGVAAEKIGEMYTDKENPIVPLTHSGLHAQR